MLDRYLVVGLGNPGPGYAGNRHNAGAMVLAELCRRGGVGLSRHKARALVASHRLTGGPSGAAPSLVLAQPLCYMNESGGPVKALLRWYDLPVEALVVVHDELDLPFGTVRLKFGGGEGGHNGLRSVTAALGTRDYLRVRVGIGRPPGRIPATDHVLRDFSTAERKELDHVVSAAADAVEDLVTLGLLAAQQRVHAPGG